MEPDATPEPDYYALLGVMPDAAPEDIRRVYGEQAKSAMDSDRERFALLGAAFEVLKDPTKWAAYDRRRRLAAAVPPLQNITNTGAQEPTRMGTTTMGGDATMAMPPSGSTIMSNSGGGERTQAFVLPTVCAINLSPCPLLTHAQMPDEGFCAECGVLVGAPLGDAPVERPLPKLIDAGGREFALHIGENIVGREGADVMLPDKTVSRRHARIVVDDNTVWLEDTGSTNGTRRAGMPLPAGQKQSLADQMAVQFGSVKLTILIPANPNAAPLLALPLPSASTTQNDTRPLAALAAPSGSENASARLVSAGGDVTILTSEKTTFGRKPGNTVVITGDSFVSGSHAEIVYHNEQYALTDLNSTNGTKRNGVRIPPHSPQTLSDGDTIILGQTPYTFRLPG